MRAWQIVFLVLAGAGLLLHAYKHGQPRDNYNLWWALLATAIELFIVWKGGFFK